jgi:guanylate kinase
MSSTSARLFVIAAPSGAGKTTLVKALTTRNPELRFSISYTTRPKRRNEAHGVDYLFVGKDEFDRLRTDGALLESANVFDNFYGTSREQVEEHLAADHNVILEIDWQGARQVRAVFPGCCSIFIIPPSLETLRKRLKGRGQDSEEIIQRRMRDAQAEISHWDEFEYLVVNDDFNAALDELIAIINDHRRHKPHIMNKNNQLLAQQLGRI